MGYLEATFDVMSLPDLLQWIGAAAKSGRCRLRNGQATRTLYMRNGHIVACTGDEPHLLLGQFLLYQGRIDEDLLRRCLKRQEATGMTLGAILIETGEIDPEELQRRVTAKAEETVLGLFDWDTCTFRFDPDVGPPANAMKVDIDVSRLVFEGVRRFDECNHLRTVFPSDDVILHATDRAPSAQAVASHMGHRLYELINGRRTLGELILASRSPRYHALSFLGRLVEIGVVRVGEPRSAAPDPALMPEPPEETLRRLVERGAYRQALDLVEQLDLTSHDHDATGMLVARAEAGFLAEAYRTVTPPDSVPGLIGDAAIAADEPFLTEEESFLLQLIDGRWDVRSLVWIAPLRKIETVRALTRLVERGVVEIREAANPDAGGAAAIEIDASEVADTVDGRLG